MLFGAWGDKETENRFSIDMAAAAHRNKVREQNEDFITSDSEKQESPEQPRLRQTEEVKQ